MFCPLFFFYEELRDLIQAARAPHCRHLQRRVFNGYCAIRWQSLVAHAVRAWEDDASDLHFQLRYLKLHLSMCSAEAGWGELAEPGSPEPQRRPQNLRGPLLLSASWEAASVLSPTGTIRTSP